MPPKCDRSGCDIEREAVERDPALHAHAQRADLRFVGALADPDPDAPVGAVRADAELGQGVDHPAFERMDEAADVLSAFFEVEHHIADALARAVIGVAAAATGFVDREAERIEELGRVGAGAGGEQGGCSSSHTHSRAVPSRIAAARCSMKASASS